MEVVKALSAPDPTGKRPRSRLFSSREHQDAQELFQLLSSSIQDEANEVDAESHKDLGLAAVDRSEKVARKDAGKTVFEGLTANRRSCMTCGYTEAVMHFPFDNLNLAVPRLVCTCSFVSYLL
jgi:ubiquitin carboxyl-terminal hydrolase 1